MMMNRYKKIAAKLGVNYVWGLVNLLIGTVGGAFWAGIAAGFINAS
jgi:hypothetical protein